MRSWRCPVNFSSIPDHCCGRQSRSSLQQLRAFMLTLTSYLVSSTSLQFLHFLLQRSWRGVSLYANHNTHLENNEHAIPSCSLFHTCSCLLRNIHCSITDASVAFFAVLEHNASGHITYTIHLSFPVLPPSPQNNNERRQGTGGRCEAPGFFGCCAACARPWRPWCPRFS